MLQKHKEENDAEFLANLGEAIRVRRLALGLSQEDVAARANVHRTYLSDIERGTRNITVGMLAQVAGALQMKLAHLTRQAEAAKEDV
ncbi:MAG TPA: helix-turn-helix transcriptional regulator [Trichormus sp.]|jgi:transcriptional regulator with XRE-family HTH domain